MDVTWRRWTIARELLSALSWRQFFLCTKNCIVFFEETWSLKVKAVFHDLKDIQKYLCALVPLIILFTSPSCSKNAGMWVYSSIYAKYFHTMSCIKEGIIITTFIILIVPFVNKRIYFFCLKFLVFTGHARKIRNPLLVIWPIPFLSPKIRNTYWRGCTTTPPPYSLQKNNLTTIPNPYCSL